MSHVSSMLVMCCFCLSKTCPVNKGLNRQSILKTLDEATQGNITDTISLNKLFNLTSSHEPSPDDIIIRAALWTTVELRCPAGDDYPAPTQDPPYKFNGVLQSPNTTNLEDDRNVMWNICLRPRPQCGELIQVYTPVAYTPMTPGDRFYTITLFNFSQTHSGVYECLQYNGTQLVTTRRYRVSPRMARETLFDPPMSNMTVTVGEEVKLRCYVKFDAVPHPFGERFLLRREEYLIYASDHGPFRNGVGSRYGADTWYSIFDDGCKCGLQLRISNVNRRDAGRYQCWFRVDDLFDEWFVQEFYLNVEQKGTDR
ncbi:uncharacterized protein LOC129588844 [Paramacrobiotus metropolitanus]|uniref:uncharacterized protein LOC129588844 n=1 Tax=Paramacrobiotus metropolitanus TaxID=2943436 RepID=UPI0024459EEF|nr:uncharacterized protein LOC129588844 [Paramacrobiotus metropolitanus]